MALPVSVKGAEVKLIGFLEFNVDDVASAKFILETGLGPVDVPELRDEFVVKTLLKLKILSSSLSAVKEV